MYATSSHVQQVHHPPPHNHQPNVNGHPHPMQPNGSSLHQTPPPTQSHRSAPSAATKEPIVVVGIPSVSIQNNQLQVGNSQTSQCLCAASTCFVYCMRVGLSSYSDSTRSYTPLKVLGDGSFGTVWLCDWHGTLPPNTPLSPMQCGAGARPEWVGKRLVAVKRMKKKWEGGWDECKKLKELEVSGLHASQTSYSSLKSDIISRYGQYHSTLISSRYMTFSSCQHPKSCISFLNPWKGICTISSRLEKDGH